MIINDLKLSENFNLSEFKCPGSELIKLDMNLVYKLQELRDLAKAPVIIMSGYRTPEYNKAIGGDPQSFHLPGMAADIHITGYIPEHIYYLAKLVGFNGIGLYDTWVHVDVADKPHRWDSRVKNAGKDLIIKIVV